LFNILFGVMEVYDPTDDILRFRAFRPPWVRVECVERLFHEQRVQPIAFIQRDGLVLLHMLDDSAAYALSVFRSDSPESEYGELVGSYENIWHFDANA
jgi:hypothetical protein